MSHSIKRLIGNAEKVSLTGEQMELITEGKCRVVTYEELENCETIDDCFRDKLGLIILYQKKSNFGHWSVLYKTSNDTLNFFDSYGFQMDTELKFSDFNLRQHNGVETPHLTALIDKSHYKLTQNKVQYQKRENDLNTCGRHACVRFRMREYNNKQYADLFKKVDSDFYVSALTLLYSDFEN
jgi:hypothetical protein